ncbi:MAG: sortase domain-bontaining protein [Nitriliruptoraceae bacterium]
MSMIRVYAVVTGLVLLIGAPVAWHLSRAAADDLDVVAAPVREMEPVAEPEAQPAPEPEAGPSSEPTPEAAPEAVADPVRVSLPRLGVDAPLDAVGLDPDGSMEIPHDVQRVGWYSLGVTPGQPRGTAVLSGHVDDREQGRGALWALRTMQPGDDVTVTHADGSTSVWRVDRTTSYPKPELPIPDIFTRFGDPRLVLITCGGEFDASTRNYLDNIVVYASPVETAADATTVG